MLPRVPITDILVEVNNWSGFADNLVHLKTGEPLRDETYSAALATIANAQHQRPEA